MIYSKECDSISLHMQQNNFSKQLISTVSSKGQVTIPVEIRRHLRVETKDKVAFVVEPNGKVGLTQAKYPDIASLSGAAGRLKKPVSWKKMREIAREDRVAQKYGR